jgi:HEPN/RES N-terminal domain 1/RES domain
VDPDDIQFRAASCGVCDRHTDDPAVRSYIQDNATLTTCDYCPREATTPIAVWLADFAEFVLEGAETEWGHAGNEGLPYESAEGGWQLATPLSNYELFGGETDLDPTNDDQVLTDLCDAIIGDEWVQKDFYSLSPIDRLRLGWVWFSEAVKHTRRYFFAGPTTDDPDEVAPVELLELIGRAAEEEDLVRTLATGTRVYRARVHKPDERPRSANELGAPPSQLALNANRMSPAGISMFYGALDPGTAQAEAAAANSDPEQSRVTVGTFITLKEVRVLDLSAPPEVPSVFDRDRRHLRPQLAFLHEFVGDLREPIVRDRSEHVEYVPTQIVTEYLRSHFRTADDETLDGVLFGSVKARHGVNLVLFTDNDGARDVAGAAPPADGDAVATLVRSLRLSPTLELAECSDGSIPSPDG